MEDNVWEYPFGELDDDEDMFYREPERLVKGKHQFSLYGPLPRITNPG